MIDLSKAEGSRNHKLSFDKTAKNIIDHVTSLIEEYQSVWIPLEKVRKEYAAIKENVILIIKNNKIKIGQPLSRCNNEELNVELLKIVDALPYELREEIQISLVKLNNRYSKIVEYGEQLEQISAKLSAIAIKEPDYEEEVVVSLPVPESFSSPKLNVPASDDKLNVEDEEIEQVISTKPASEELLADLQRINELENTMEVPAMRFPEESVIDKSNEEGTQDNDINSIIDFIDNKINIQDDSVPFLLNGMTTIMDIAKNAYGDSSYWHLIYNYKDNASKIDYIAGENGVSIEVVAADPRYTDGLQIYIPSEISKVKTQTDDSQYSWARVA